MLKSEKLQDEAYFVTYPAASIKDISQSNLHALLVCSQIANDICLLQRLALVFERGFERSIDDKPERNAQNVMWHNALLLLAGKIWEGWEACNRTLPRSIDALWRHVEVTRQALKSYAGLRKHFKAQKSPMMLIRHNVSFHYNTDKLLKQQAVRLRADDFQILLGSATGNTLYLSSDVLRILMLLDLIWPRSRFEQDFSKWQKDNNAIEVQFRNWQHLMFHDLVVGVSEDLGRFLNDLIAALLASIKAPPQVASISMSGRPTSMSQRLPFLVQMREAINATEQ